MKRLVSFLLALTLLAGIAAAASADVLTIDTETAGYDEIVEALHILKAAQITRLTELVASECSIEPADGITFRGIPWHSGIKAVRDSITQEPLDYNRKNRSDLRCSRWRCFAAKR